MVVALLDRPQIERARLLGADQIAQAIDIERARPGEVAHGQFHMAGAHDVERRGEDGLADGHCGFYGGLRRPIVPRARQPARSLPSGSLHASCHLQHSRPAELRRRVRRWRRRSAPAARPAADLGSGCAARGRARRGQDRSPPACGPDFPLAEVELLPPVVGGEKILCIGVNYANRDAELTAAGGNTEAKYPSMFFKPPNTLGRAQPADPAAAGIRAARIRGRDRAGHRQDRPAHPEGPRAGLRRRHHHVQRGHHPRLDPARPLQRHPGQVPGIRPAASGRG